MSTSDVSVPLPPRSIHSWVHAGRDIWVTRESIFWGSSFHTDEAERRRGAQRIPTYGMYDGREAHELAHMVEAPDHHLWKADYGYPILVGENDKLNTAEVYREARVIAIQYVIDNYVTDESWRSGGGRGQSLYEFLHMLLKVRFCKMDMEYPRQNNYLRLSDYYYAVDQDTAVRREKLEFIILDVCTEKQWDIGAVWAEYNRKLNMIRARRNETPAPVPQEVVASDAVPLRGVITYKPQVEYSSSFEDVQKRLANSMFDAALRHARQSLNLQTVNRSMRRQYEASEKEDYDAMVKFYAYNHKNSRYGGRY